MDTMIVGKPLPETERESVGVLYLRDPQGRLVPIDNVKPQHKLEDEMVRALHAEAKRLSDALRDFREQAFDQISSFFELIYQEYEAAPRGGLKGNVTLQSYDGLLRMQVAIGETISFGPELQSAKALIDDCITRWSEGSNANLRTIVMDAFAVNKEGKIDTDRVLGLKRLEIADPAWLRAMTAIGDAVKITSSKRYLRFYTRPNAEANFEQVPLDIARA